MFHGQTILLPPTGPLPMKSAFLKRVERIEDEAVITVYLQQGPRGSKTPIPPFHAKVLDCRYHLDFLQCSLGNIDGPPWARNANTDNDILVEVTPTEGVMVDNPFLSDTSQKEDALLEKLHDNPELIKEIPEEQWAKDMFQKKFVLENLTLDGYSEYVPDSVMALATARKLDFASRETGHPLIRKFADKLGVFAPKVENKVLDYLGLKPESRHNQHLAAVLNESRSRTQGAAGRGGRKRTRKKRKKRYHKSWSA